MDKKSQAAGVVAALLCEAFAGFYVSFPRGFTMLATWVAMFWLFGTGGLIPAYIGTVVGMVIVVQRHNQEIDAKQEALEMRRRQELMAANQRS